MKTKILVVVLPVLFLVLSPGLVAYATGEGVYFGQPSAVRIGVTSEVPFFVGSPDQSVNAVEGQIVYDVSKIEVVQINRSGSIMSLWVAEPTFSNTNGVIEFAGTSFNPGYTGSGGKIFSIVFRPRVIGNASFTASGTKILANDGLGTELPSASGATSFQILPALPKPEIKEAIPETSQPADDQSQEPGSGPGESSSSTVPTIMSDLLEMLGNTDLPPESASLIIDKIPEDTLLAAPAVVEMVAEKEALIDKYQVATAAAAAANAVSVGYSVVTWSRMLQLKKAAGALGKAAKFLKG